MLFCWISATKDIRADISMYIKYHVIPLWKCATSLPHKLINEFKLKMWCFWFFVFFWFVLFAFCRQPKSSLFIHSNLRVCCELTTTAHLHSLTCALMSHTATPCTRPACLSLWPLLPRHTISVRHPMVERDDSDAFKKRTGGPLWITITPFHLYTCVDRWPVNSATSRPSWPTIRPV